MNQNEFISFSIALFYCAFLLRLRLSLFQHRRNRKAHQKKILIAGKTTTAAAPQQKKRTFLFYCGALLLRHSSIAALFYCGALGAMEEERRNWSAFILSQIKLNTQFQNLFITRLIFSAAPLAMWIRQIWMKLTWEQQQHVTAAQQLQHLLHRVSRVQEKVPLTENQESVISGFRYDLKGIFNFGGSTNNSQIQM